MAGCTVVTITVAVIVALSISRLKVIYAQGVIKLLYPNNEDSFRQRVGWKGELKLFQDGYAQHTERTGHELAPDCEYCLMFSKNLLRLMNEGNKIAEEYSNLSKGERIEFMNKKGDDPDGVPT